MKCKLYRLFIDKAFAIVCAVATCIGILALIVLLYNVIADAAGWLDWDFISKTPSRFAAKAGIYPLIIGSFMVVALVALFSLPLGVCAAVYLEEYAEKNRLTKVIETNIANLAGVPSIIFGLLGLGIFVSFMGLGPGIVLVGAFTLTLRVLPIVIISTQEAIRAVPDTLREASYGLGASQWQTIHHVVLPKALPSIMTGLILSVSNAIGESAPLIMVGVATSIFRAPTGLLSPFGALPLQIFAWSDYPVKEFQHGVVPAAIVVLLAILIFLNLTTIYI
ncbi:MAG TPA: phosphate ABC transporter permease PstA, partial [Spirochaetota bacterium]|nr:phosphate ABC transporter permease PstA [Spirochaetota bacterium]